MQLKVIFLRMKIKQPYYMVKPLPGMILESYISYDKNWLLKPSILKSKQQKSILMICVLKMTLTDTWITDSWQKNEYGTIQLIEGIGKIKLINLLKMN
jgi:hypothetical protein